MSTEEALTGKDLLKVCLHCVKNSDLISGQSLAYRYLSGEVKDMGLYQPYKLGTMCSAAQRVEAWLYLLGKGQISVRDCVLQVLWILGSLTSPSKVQKEILSCS